MDKAEKKKRRNEWQARQRAAAREALPLAEDILRELFDAVESEMQERPCDNTRAFTEAWLETRGVASEAVLTWLDEQGGFCDCEVDANASQAFREALGED